MTAILCLIPARGGSKRIPRKNLLNLAGQPLLSYTIEAAVQANLFTDIVVSSDDSEILSVAKGYGAEADRRPVDLSQDTTRFVEVVAEYLQRPEQRDRYQVVAALLPTCPFRTAADLQAAWQQFTQQQHQGFLISVSEYDFPPQLALDLEPATHQLTMRDSATYGRTTRSQSLGKAYHPNGAIYMTTVDNFLEQQTFFGDPLVGFAMPPERSLDIDYPYQLEIADFWMRRRDAPNDSKNS